MPPAGPEVKDIDELLALPDDGADPVALVVDGRLSAEERTPGLVVRDAVAAAVGEAVREDGYYPIFEFRHMVQTLREANGHDTWTPLEAVQCPALVVKGGASNSPREVLLEMATKMKKGTFVEVPGATHVVHNGRPEEWREAVEGFVGGPG